MKNIPVRLYLSIYNLGAQLKMNFKFLMLACLLILFYGCAYSVPSTVSPAVNIYSSYEDKIPGTVVLVIDDNIKNVSQEVKATSYVCSAHTFPVTLDSALALSVKKTTEAIFESVVEQANLPTKDQLLQMDGQGIIYIKLNRFYPKISFSQGFWSVHANASCDVVLDVTVKDANNKNLITTSVGGSRSVDGDGGAYCGNGANVLSEAMSLSMRETMERYAERLSNSEKIRTAFINQKAVTDKKATEKKEKQIQPEGSTKDAPNGK